MSELSVLVLLLESMDSDSEVELLSLGMLDDDVGAESSSCGVLLLVLLRDSSVRALREVVLVLVRVSVRAAPERSFVVEPISELASGVAADGFMSGGVAALSELELVLGTVALLLDEPYDGDDELELGAVLELVGCCDEVDVELSYDEDEELVLGCELLLDEEAGGVPSAVRHSVLRRVSVWVVLDRGVVVESEPIAVLSLALGVLVALGVFAVDEGAGIVCVVVDSATRVCSCTVRCCLSVVCAWS